MLIAKTYCVHDRGVTLGIADLLFTCVKSQSLWCVHAYLSNVKRAPLGLGRSLRKSMHPIYTGINGDNSIKNHTIIYKHHTITPKKSQRKESCLSTKPPWRYISIPQTWQPRALNVDGTRRELTHVVNLPITPTSIDKMYRWSTLHTKKWQFALALWLLCQPYTKSFVVIIERVFRSLFKYSPW